MTKHCVTYCSSVRMFCSSRRRRIRILVWLLALVVVELVYSPVLYISDKFSMWVCQDGCRRDTCNGCLTHNFTYLIQNVSICRLGSSGRIDLMIVIASEHSQRFRRNVLRETWLSVAKRNSANVRYAFLLGASRDRTMMQMVYEESEVHGDILMEDFADSYLNLTHKTIMGIQWAATHCRHAGHFMKTDHDMWVNVPRILNVLATRSAELHSSIGGLCFNTFPFRFPYSKWYTSFTSYPHIAYPGYCSGAGYVTSMAVIEKVNGIYPDVPFFTWEDVYVGLCLQQLKLGVTNFRGFYRHLLTLDPCRMRSEVLTSHGVPLHLMFKYRDAKCLSDV